MASFEELLNDPATTNEVDNEGDVPDLAIPQPNSKQQSLLTAAKNLGISPRDLAAAISYESEGTFSPKIWGGTGRNYLGLIQFGPEERRQFGVSPNQSFEQQMQSVESFLRTRGVKPGMDISGIYRTINGGNPNASLNANDGNGTIAQHIAKIKAEHYGAADNFLQGLIQSQDNVRGMQASYRPPETDEELNQPAVLPPRKMITPPSDERVAEINAGNQELVPFLDQLVAKSGTAVADTPYNLLSLLMLPSTLLGSTTAQKIIEANQASEKNNKGIIENAVGAEANPQTPGGKLGATIGKNVLPVGKLTLPFTALGTGVDFLKSLITPEDATAKKTKEVDPLAVARTQQYIYDGMPYDPNVTQFEPNERTVVLEGRKRIKWDGNNEGITTIKSTNGKYYNVLGDGSPLNNTNIAGTIGWANVPSYDNEQLAKEAAVRMRLALQQESDKRKVSIDSFGGPNSVDMASLYKYGGMAAATTAGLIFAPWAIKKMRLAELPTLWRDVREVPFTHPDVGAISVPLDWFATATHNVHAGPMRIASRAGLNPLTVDEIAKQFNIETHGGAQLLGDAAVKNGNMRSLNYQFKVDVPMAQLNEMDNPQVSQYLHAKNIADQFAEFQTKNLMQPKSKPAPTTIRGFTEPQVIQLINDMETVNPKLKDIQKAYNENISATRNFMANGEFAVMPKQEARILNQTRQTYIHGLDDQIGNPVPIGSATHDTAQWMQDQIRFRLQNEARGTYIDATKNQDIGRGKKLFQQITSEELAANPKWKDNVVTVYRRGKPEYYATEPFLASMLKMDPYYPTGMMKLAGVPARFLMKTTTGEWAPWFAVRSFYRNHKLTVQSTPEGTKAPWFVQSAWAIPQQLTPQIAKSIGESLDHGSMGWLSNVFGQQGVDGLAARLMQAYEKSFEAQMQAAGTPYGSYLQQMKRANDQLNQAMTTADPTFLSYLKSVVSHTGAGYRSTLQAIHNAPQHAWARRNQGVYTDPAELAYEARRLTGNPLAGGQARTNKGTIPFSTEGMGWVGKGTNAVLRPLGLGVDIARETIPWWNASTQGMKRLGQAYLDNPTKFMGRVWLYNQMPAAANYMWAMSAGNNGVDPNGRSYTDYMMNGRSEWDKMMYQYIAIPGKPAEDGLRIPRYHEGAGAAVMMETALDHAFRNNLFPMGEDAKRVALSFMGVVNPVTTPAVVGAGIGLSGQIPPMNALTGTPYTPRERVPFDQFSSGLPQSLETFIRAVAPGTGDIAVKTYSAAHSSPDTWSALVNAGKTVGKEVARKTDTVNTLLGLQGPVAGNIPIMEEYYNNKKQIDRLVSYYTKNDTERKTDPLGRLTTRSKEGGAVMNAFRPPNTITSNTGMDAPEPTNPLYAQFIETIKTRFKSDTSANGGIGFLTASQDLGEATDYMRKLRSVNEGNTQAWIKEHNSKPDYVNELKRMGVDPNNVKAVRSYFATKQQDSARRLLFMIRTVEKEIGHKLSDLEPYKNGSMQQEPPPEE